MVGGGGKMAELMLLSEIADPTRFFTDNLLSPEDWGVQREARGQGAGCGRPWARRHAGRRQRADAEPMVRGSAPRGPCWPGRREEGRSCPPAGARGRPGSGERGRTP